MKVAAPHAQYAVGDADSTRGHLVPLPDDVSFEEGTFLLLCSQATAWTASSGVKKGDTVVILGQGVVGSLMMQIMRGYEPERIITVDALPLRCRISKELGADLVINGSDEDPVDAVRQLTDGKGADIVVDCVGGYAGIKSFEQRAGHGARQRHNPTHRRLSTGAAAPALFQNHAQAPHRWRRVGCAAITTTFPSVGKDSGRRNSGCQNDYPSAKEAFPFMQAKESLRIPTYAFANNRPIVMHKSG